MVGTTKIKNSIKYKAQIWKTGPKLVEMCQKWVKNGVKIGQMGQNG